MLHITHHPSVSKRVGNDELTRTVIALSRTIMWDSIWHVIICYIHQGHRRMLAVLESQAIGPSHFFLRLFKIVGQLWSNFKLWELAYTNVYLFVYLQQSEHKSYILICVVEHKWTGNNILVFLRERDCE